MKKFTVKASALAIAAALPGVAAAQVTLGTAPTTSFASELIAATGSNVTVGTVRTALGFGVSNGQDRYIRVDLSGAKMVGAPTLDVVNSANACGTADLDATETVVQGGAANDTSVIFQITANIAAGLTSAANVCFSGNATGAVALTSAAGASLTYSLYADPSSAVAGGTSGRLATKTGVIASTASGLDFTVTPGSATASVATSYKRFLGGDSNAAIGEISLETAANTTNLGGAGIVISDLISAANVIITAADLTSTSNAAGAGIVLRESAGGGCALGGGLGGTSTQTSSTVRTISGLGGGFPAHEACFEVTGTTSQPAIAEQSLTVALDITPALGTGTVDIAAQALGDIVRDGVTLKAAYMAGAGGQSTWIQVANVSATAAPWTINCYSPTGSAGTGASGTLAAGATGKLFYNSLGCAAGTNAVELIISAPAGSVVGTLVRQSTTTGDSALDSLTGNQ
jgi:hypothetical protein